MAKRHRIVTSEDATTVLVEGDRKNPEPTYVIVKFPGGSLELTRTSGGDYWAHIATTKGVAGEQTHDVVDSRIDYTFEQRERGVPKLPEMNSIEQIAVRIARIRKDDDDE